MQAPAVGEVSSGGRKHAQMGSTEKCFEPSVLEPNVLGFWRSRAYRKKLKRSETGSAKNPAAWAAATRWRAPAGRARRPGRGGGCPEGLGGVLRLKHASEGEGRGARLGRGCTGWLEGLGRAKDQKAGAGGLPKALRAAEGCLQGVFRRG